MSDQSDQVAKELGVDGLEEGVEVLEDTSQPPTKQRIVKLLTPAVRLWLKTQVDAVEDLQIEIQSGDRALLSGKIQQVSLQARQVVYQGLHLSFVSVSASNIQINLGQVLRGKPLKLLAPIPIQGEAQIREQDLNASTNAELLANALTDFLSSFLQVGLAATGTPPLRLTTPQIRIGAGYAELSGLLKSADQQEQAIGVQMHLALPSPQMLLFKQIAWLSDIPPGDRQPATWDDITIDLGPDVRLEQVTLSPGEIRCRASLTIMP